MKIATAIFKRDDWKITSWYGVRIHPTLLVPYFHSGIDFGTKLEPWQVFGLERGQVIASNYDSNNGNYIWVIYPRVNLKIFMCHLIARYVVKGEYIDENTVLGAVGKSGRAKGVHLHMGVKRITTDKYFNFENYEYLTEAAEALTKKYLYLSKHAKTWNVYPLDKPARAGNEVGKLAPSRFAGLKYEILEELPNSVYVINTSTFGKVKIWAGTGSLSYIKQE